VNAFIPAALLCLLRKQIDEKFKESTSVEFIRGLGDSKILKSIFSVFLLKSADSLIVSAADFDIRSLLL
jgi:hypothetical protein